MDGITKQTRRQSYDGIRTRSGERCKDSRESNYKAVPSYYESGKIARVATGTGPISWSHDKTIGP